MALPLYVPFGYITFLVGLLWLFSRHYRSRALRRKPPPPWFPEPHTARDVYVSLLSMDSPPSQPVLVSALLARAMTDVKRIISLKEAKQAMMNLLQKGQVGDELWERLLVAEKELDVEISEVVAEANEYSEGWGGSIFAIASEALQATMCQDIYKKIPEQRSRLTAEFNASRLFASNPGALRILGSKPAVPAAPLKPSPSSTPPISAPPTSQAKLAMLENIRAAQAKLKSEEEKKHSAQPTSSASTKLKTSSTGTSPGPQSDTDPEETTNPSKSEPASASKKKKPKKKKKN